MPNLDLLRCIAVVLVVVEHTLLAMHFRWIGTWDISWLGVVGVFMFFVHTSLVLMWSLERKPHVLDFYIRRIFRIYPLAVTVVIVTVLFHIPTMHNIDGSTFFQMPGLKTIAANILLMQNMLNGNNILGVMWSLPLEIDMYFLLPFLFFFVRQNFVIWPLLFLFGITALYDRDAFQPTSSSFVVCIPYFLSGIIAYVLFANVRPRLPAFLMPLLIALLLAAFMESPSWKHGWWLTLALGLLLPFFRPLQWQWLAKLSHLVAKYSYGVYLVHPFSIAFGVNYLHEYNPAIQIAAVMATIPLVAVPAYHFLEKPMIDFGERLAARIERRYELAVFAE